MSYITWNDDLAVGNAFIDSDHRKLIGLVNDLHDAMAEGKGKEVLGATLSNLIKYTAAHFKREEDEMARIGYSGAIAHRQEHEKLVREVLSLQQKFNDGNALLTVKVSKFLKDWLVEHIMKTDKAFSKAIQLAASGR